MIDALSAVLQLLGAVGLIAWAGLLISYALEGKR